MEGVVLSPKEAMGLAFKEAKRGLGWVEPNPPVGCVILDSNYKLLSSGYHKKYGEDHAEVSALKKIKNKQLLKGSHVFVTLEPCDHIGKTPSCTNELAKYPIQSIRYVSEDPFTKKKGLNFLKTKGINIIQVSDYQKEIENIMAPFKFTLLNQKAFVSLKVGSSLDGVMALKNGESKWITSKKSRDHSYFLRAMHSAVLIGVNTFLKDNPYLNIRLDEFKNKKNKVIILDPKGQSLALLLKSHLLEAHSPEDIIVCCSKKTSNDLGVKIKYLENNLFSLPDLMENLYREESVNSILVEGGAFSISQFIQQKSAQKMYLYMAPSIIGSGIHWSKYVNTLSLSQSVKLNAIHGSNIGDDFLIEGFFHKI